VTAQPRTPVVQTCAQIFADPLPATESQGDLTIEAAEV